LFPVKEIKNPRQKRMFQDIWYNVWLEKKYASPDDNIKEKYSKHDAYSTDLMLYFLRLIPIGTMRIIWQTGPTLPTLEHFETEKVWNGPLVEFTLFSVKKKWRKYHGLFSLFLMRKSYRIATMANMDGIIIITERNLFVLLSRIVKLPFKRIGPEKFYEGGDCFPAYMNIKEAERVLPKRSSDLNRFFIPKEKRC